MSCSRLSQLVSTIPIIAIILGIGLPLFASTEDEQFLEGLRKRRLFSLAESFCQQRLADAQLADLDRGQLTIEFIRSYAGHAINSAPKERGEFWKKAHDVADEFVLRHRDNPRHLLVRVQKALTHLAHGQLVRQELEAGAAAAGARDTALAQLRDAARLMTELDDELTKLIPQRRRRKPDEGELTADELFSLQNNIRYQLARTYRNRALCYAKDSVDRIDALTRVNEQHYELMRRLPEDDPLRWKIRIESIVCKRLLGKFENVRQEITSLQSLVPPAEIQLRARAESVRLELAVNRPTVALSVLAQGRTIESQISPELDFAYLETFDASARADAKDEKKSAEWQKKAVAMAQLIEHTHGPYWARRANLLLVRSATTGTGTRDVEILIRLADDLYVKGQLRQAVQSYDKAARQAQSSNNTEQAFTLFYKAALVEHTQRQHAEASRRLRDLGLAMKTHAKASNAHLLAAWNTSQLAAKDSNAITLYAELLEEQIATWPEKTTADKARMWLGRLREHERIWTEAIDIYLEVSPASDRFSDAVEAAARCSQHYFAELKAAGQPFEEQAKLSAQRFEDIIFDKDRQLPKEWKPAHQVAAVAAARIRLQFVDNDHAAAGNILEAALTGSPNATSAWTSTVQSLLVVALAGQPRRHADATKILNSLADNSPQQLLEMLDGLATIGESARQTVQVEIAKLQLNALADISTDKLKLDAAGKLRLEQIEASALAAAGRYDEAKTKYEKLAARHPRNGRIQEGYAQLLVKSDDKAALEKALVQWRKVDQGSRPQSERWYRAKYSIALAHFKLGDKKRAAQIIAYLKVTPPGLDATALKPQFERLLTRCGE